MKDCETRKRVSELTVGDKFFTDGRTMYLKIDFELSTVSLTTKFPAVTCALDLSTYRIVCIEDEKEVQVETDNVFI